MRTGNRVLEGYIKRLGDAESVSVTQLTILAELIAANKDLSSFKENVLLVGKSLNDSSNVLKSVEYSLNNVNPDDEEIGTNFDALNELYKVASSNSLNSMKDNNQLTTRLKELLYKNDGDDDIQALDDVIYDCNIKCPVLGLAMSKPFKNANCKHFISQEGFKYLTKTKATIKCPVAGCAATWSNQSCELDKEFSYRLERHRAGHSSSQL